MSNIWGNYDNFAEQYCCATVLYSLSILAHAYNIMIDCGVGALGNFREVVDGLNSTKNKFNFNDKCATAWCSSL